MEVILIDETGTGSLRQEGDDGLISLTLVKIKILNLMFRDCSNNICNKYFISLAYKNVGKCRQKLFSKTSIFSKTRTS